MNLNDLVQTGICQKPPRIVLYGPHGIGKSTFGAQAPDPIFITTEDGLTNIDVPHFPLATSIDDIWSYIGMLVNEDHNYKTAVVDTIDWFETLAWNEVCKEGKVDNIEDFGYGKGYTKATAHWLELIRGMNRLRDEKGMGIVLLAHSEIKTFNPPDADPWDRYQIKIHRHAQAKIEEWADAVLFANFQVYVKGSQTDKKGHVKPGKGIGGERVIHTQPHPAWRAKNRYGLPAEVKFDFNTLLENIKS